MDRPKRKNKEVLRLTYKVPEKQKKKRKEIIKATKTYAIKYMINTNLSEEIDKQKTKTKKLNYLKNILINKLNLRGRTIKEVEKKTEDDKRISYRKIKLLYLIIVLLNIDEIYYKGKKHNIIRERKIIEKIKKLGQNLYNLYFVEGYENNYNLQTLLEKEKIAIEEIVKNEKKADQKKIYILLRELRTTSNFFINYQYFPSLPKELQEKLRRSSSKSSKSSKSLSNSLSSNNSLSSRSSLSSRQSSRQGAAARTSPRAVATSQQAVRTSPRGVSTSQQAARRLSPQGMRRLSPEGARRLSPQAMRRLSPQAARRVLPQAARRSPEIESVLGKRKKEDSGSSINSEDLEIIIEDEKKPFTKEQKKILKEINNIIYKKDPNEYGWDIKNRTVLNWINIVDNDKIKNIIEGLYILTNNDIINEYFDSLISLIFLSDISKFVDRFCKHYNKKKNIEIDENGWMYGYQKSVYEYVEEL